MRLLAIDTSLAEGSVAALDGDRRAARALAAGGHARDLAGALAAVAADLGWSVRDAELIAVVRGPGSFTGLRVGVTTAKALAWANAARLVAVSGFEVVARTSARLADWPTDAVVHVAFDAGRGDVYASAVTPTATEPTGWCIGQPAIQPATAWLAGLPANARVSGPALAALAERLETTGFEIAPVAAWRPTAGEVGLVAALRAAAGDGDDPHALVPEYLRPNYADERAAGTIGPG